MAREKQKSLRQDKAETRKAAAIAKAEQELSEAPLNDVTGGKASPTLMLHCVTGKHIDKGTITC